MYRINLDPNSAADLDLCKFVSDIDRTHLLEFVGQLTTQLPAKINDISPSVIRQHYLPCMAAVVKIMAADNDMFRNMAMEREMLVDQYIANYIADEYTGGMLYNFCTLAYYMAVYMNYEDQAEKFGFRNYAYSNLHYIEYSLYGDDTYMNNIDPMPDGLYGRLWEKFGNYYSGDYNARIEFLICAAIESAYNSGDNQLIVDNARDIITMGVHILPLHMQEYIGNILGMACRAIGRESEVLAIMNEENVKRYGKSDLFDFAMTGMVVKKSDSQTLSDFEAYRDKLKKEGYRFADYLPWYGSGEYIDDSNYDVYSQYFKEGAKLLGEAWKEIANILYRSPSNNSQFKPVLDYFECETEEQFVMMSLFVANQIFNNGDTALALDIIDRALAYYDNLYKTLVPYEVMSIAGIYYQLGDTDKVDEILYKYMLPYMGVCEYRDEFLFSDLSYTASCAALLAEYHKDQTERAVELADRAMSKIDRLQSDNDKAHILGLLCGCYYDMDNYQKALEIMNRTLQYDIADEQRAWIELGGAEIYYRMHQWSRAVDVYKRYYVGEYSSFMSAPFYGEMMSCAAHADDKECMRDTADKYIKSIRSEIDDKLYNLSSEERERFWSSIADQNMFAEICEAVHDDEEQKAVLASCAYDYSLMMKGLLLNADNRIDRLLTEHPDSVVRKRYAQMKDLSARIDNMTLRGGDPTQMTFLREALTTAQRDITMVVRSMGIDSDMAGTVDWRDVQNRLGDNDVAIEFMRLTGGSNDDVEPVYVAVVLRRDWSSPKIVELCKESVLKQYAHGEQQRNRRLYNGFEITKLWPLIWQPLQDYVTEGETLYFAADGLINMLNIGAVRPEGNDRRTADERYTLHRLSSTRELCRDRSGGNIERAVIYGGLNYDMGAEVMAEQTKTYADVDLAASRSVSRGSVADGMLPETYLKETYDEALDIAAMLQSTGISADLFTGERGIEESFKALSGERFELLHLGTHGFYMTCATEYQVGDELLSPMMRAGLMLSRKKKVAADDREDGLLLAREIADMDLSSVDIVVLSACQTAQGDITGDGVFGLQRGFKQAGVGSIVMTLWEVDSEMTQYMMTAFYRNMADGMERHDAFRAARAATKAEYPDKDWAAFIMLD